MRRWSRLKTILIFIVFSMGVFGLVGCPEDAEDPIGPLGIGYPATLHAIICIADNDPSIGFSTFQDMLSVNVWLDAIIQNAGLTPNKIFLRGAEGKLHSSVLTATIRDLPVEPNDVIIFYYSGHGGNLENGSKWPVMIFSANDYPNFYDISKQLKEKGARLLISLADCCNNYASQAKRIAPLLAQRGTPSPYQALFFQHKGSIVMTAALPGEFSFGDWQGGVFTVQFLQAFYTNADSNNPNWQTIVDEASKTLGTYDETGTLNIFHPQNEFQISGL